MLEVLKRINTLAQKEREQHELESRIREEQKM